MTTPTTTAAAVAMTILNTRSFRLQMLAKLTGMGMDHLGRGLGAEQKPTVKVLLSAMEQTLLNSVAENITQIKAHAAIREAALRDELDQLHDELDQQRSLNFALAVENGELRDEQQLAKTGLAYVEQCYRLEQAKNHALQTRSFWQRLRG